MIFNPSYKTQLNKIGLNMTYFYNAFTASLLETWVGVNPKQLVSMTVLLLDIYFAISKNNICARNRIRNMELQATL